MQSQRVAETGTGAAGDAVSSLTGKRRRSALTPLSGCTADSGRPAAELRSMDLSSRVRERAELGE